MNEILERQLFDELYKIYWNSQEFVLVDSVFVKYLTTLDAVISINLLKKALLECKSTTSNLLIYLGDTNENAQERVDLLLDLWLNCDADEKEDDPYDTGELEEPSREI